MSGIIGVIAHVQDFYCNFFFFFFPFFHLGFCFKCTLWECVESVVFIDLSSGNCSHINAPKTVGGKNRVLGLPSTLGTPNFQYR